MSLAEGDRRPAVEAQCAGHRLDQADLPVEVVQIGVGQRHEQIGFVIADTRALGHEATALEVPKHGFQRPRPWTAAMTQVAGAGGYPVTGQIEVSVDVPQNAIEPLEAQSARVLADPADILDQRLEVLAAERVVVPERRVRGVGCIVLDPHRPLDLCFRGHRPAPFVTARTAPMPWLRSMPCATAA